MRILDLLFLELLHVGNLGLRLNKRVALWRRWTGWLWHSRLVSRRQDLAVALIWSRLSGNWHLIDTLTATCISTLKLLLDAHQVIKLALVFVLVDNRLILFKVVIAEVLHHEKDLTQLTIGGIS